MRILMLNNEFPPLGGGMGTVNEALIGRLDRSGDYEIDLVTSGIGGRFECESIGSHTRSYKVPVWNQNIHHSTGRELLTYAAQAFPLARNLHRSQPYDLCLAWSAVPAGAVALGLWRAHSVPYMAWVSGPDIPGFEQRYRRIYPMLTPVLRAVWREARPLIAKCAEEITMIRRVEPGLPVALIPNGVELSAFPQAVIAPGGRLRVICVARLIERKGQHHLIEAIRRLTAEGLDVVLELVGTGDSHQQLVIQAHQAGIADRVVFTGYVPRERIAQHYAAAHVFALPSFNEGLSLAALEALAAGLPLVLSRTGGTEDLVSEEVNGLTFDWADVDLLTAHLRRLSQDRGLARRMGMASRQRADRFGWDAISEQYIELFRRLAGQHMRGTGLAV